MPVQYLCHSCRKSLEGGYHAIGRRILPFSAREEKEEKKIEISVFLCYTSYIASGVIRWMWQMKLQNCVWGSQHGTLLPNYSSASWSQVALLPLLSTVHNRQWGGACIEMKPCGTRSVWITMLWGENSGNWKGQQLLGIKHGSWACTASVLFWIWYLTTAGLYTFLYFCRKTSLFPRVLR